MTKGSHIGYSFVKYKSSHSGYDYCSRIGYF